MSRYVVLVWTSSLVVTVLLIIYVLFIAYTPRPSAPDGGVAVKGNEIYLPLPHRITNMSIEEAILFRRSIREYGGEPLTIMELSMILWAAQGITDTMHRFRSAPSAGATYPLEIYVVVGENTVSINDTAYLKPGIYKYNVLRHSLVLVKEGDYRDELARAALDQEWVREAAVDIVICAVYERTTARYGDRGVRYVYMEVGHVGENIYLMSTALGLGTVSVGAFHDSQVAEIIGVGSNEHPLYIMPIGRAVKPYRTSFEEIGSFYSSNR